MQKKILMLLGVFIIGLSGCGGKRKSVTRDRGTDVAAAIDMPLASDAHPKVSFFDQDLGEFENIETFVLDDETSVPGQAAVALQDAQQDNQKDTLVVYFDYDSTKVRKDQQKQLAAVKEQVNKWVQKGCKVVFKGHSCKWHGTKDYNMALSNQRAGELAQVCLNDDTVEQAKIFGVGNEELVALDSSFEGQAPNRRVEVYALGA
ncbi:MAG: putative outer membrane lipoprotein [Candidatus Dependentiae bacterium ADurb.Bin331]|nr:MAG: putative outer membrane lipoprotein [Candidatus Dependentiae bacterium ADurb.Bin331]